MREVTLSPLADWAACGVLIMLAEAYAIHEDNLRSRFTDYGEIFRDRMALAGLITGGGLHPGIAPPPRAGRRARPGDGRSRSGDDRRRAERGAADRRGRQVRDHGAAETDDAIQRDRQPGDVGVLRLYRGGLPLSFQIVGKRFDDATVLRAAHAYEQATPWRGRRPEL